MPGAHQKLEHAEHAAHAGHKGGRNAKLFGVTMALMGVLIAVSGALVGSERNELTRELIEQTQAHGNWTSASTKFRFIMVELERQAAQPAPEKPGAESPTERLIELAGDYAEERSVSKAWEESYRPVVEAHFSAAEGYEHAQLIAELGIVLASLAVLLASRGAWVLSVLLGALCLGQIGRTYARTERVLEGAMTHVHESEHAYKNVRQSHGSVNQDEQTINQLDPDGALRAAIKARRSAPAPVHGDKHE